MSMQEMTAALLADTDPEWEVEDDVSLICPCGYSIEYDGQCPEGCVSPLREMGFI